MTIRVVSNCEFENINQNFNFINVNQNTYFNYLKNNICLKIELNGMYLKNKILLVFKLFVDVLRTNNLIIQLNYLH